MQFDQILQYRGFAFLDAVLCVAHHADIHFPTTKLGCDLERIIFSRMGTRDPEFPRRTVENIT